MVSDQAVWHASYPTKAVGTLRALSAIVGLMRNSPSGAISPLSWKPDLFEKKNLFGETMQDRLYKIDFQDRLSMKDPAGVDKKIAGGIANVNQVY